jgi:hypothetical protein
VAPSALALEVEARTHPMWQQYKKTFWGMQIVIWSVTIGLFRWTPLSHLALMLFITMQISAVYGAMWAARIKAKIDRQNGALR